jgi:NAD(P)-dependent dehydrogenase (short-subunit alcohol dehydrogenase family)
LPSVLITGAGRGIGRVAAQRMASSGWEVLAGVRDLSTAPSGCTPVQLDVASAEDLSALSGRLPERLDAVVNNAGVVVSGRVSTPFTGAYNASKFALEALADSLRMELRPWGVAVSLVEPGAIDTDIWRGALETSDGTLAAMSPEHRELYAERVTGLRKTITRTQRQAAPPEKVAEAIAAALTDRRPRARYLVGADARVQIALRGVLPTRAFDATISRLTGGR